MRPWQAGDVNRSDRKRLRDSEVAEAPKVLKQFMKVIREEAPAHLTPPARSLLAIAAALVLVAKIAEPLALRITMVIAASITNSTGGESVARVNALTECLMAEIVPIVQAIINQTGTREDQGLEDEMHRAMAIMDTRRAVQVHNMLLRFLENSSPISEMSSSLLMLVKNAAEHLYEDGYFLGNVNLPGLQDEHGSVGSPAVGDDERRGRNTPP